MNLIHHQPGRKRTLRPAPTPPSLLSLYPEKQVFGLGLRTSRSNIMTYTATNRKPCLHAKAIFAQPFIFVSRQLLHVQVVSTALVPLIYGCSADKCLVKPHLRASASSHTEALKRYTSKRYKLITHDLEEAVLGTCLSTTFTQDILSPTPCTGVSARRVCR